MTDNTDEQTTIAGRIINAISALSSTHTDDGESNVDASTDTGTIEAVAVTRNGETYPTPLIDTDESELWFFDVSMVDDMSGVHFTLQSWVATDYPIPYERLTTDRLDSLNLMVVYSKRLLGADNE